MGFQLGMGFGVTRRDAEVATEISAVLPSASVAWEVTKMRRYIRRSCIEVLAEVEEKRGGHSIGPFLIYFSHLLRFS
jgi:hypothetical protein